MNTTTAAAPTFPDLPEDNTQAIMVLEAEHRQGGQAALKMQYISELMKDPAIRSANLCLPLLHRLRQMGLPMVEGRTTTQAVFRFIERTLGIGGAQPPILPGLELLTINQLSKHPGIQAAGISRANLTSMKRKGLPMVDGKSTVATVLSFVVGLLGTQSNQHPTFKLEKVAHLAKEPRIRAAGLTRNDLYELVKADGFPMIGGHKTTVEAVLNYVGNLLSQPSPTQSPYPETLEETIARYRKRAKSRRHKGR